MSLHIACYYAVDASTLTDPDVVQAEDASGGRLEMSREVASLRLRLSAATQQAEEFRKELEVAKATPNIAEQHDTALAGFRQEISNLQEEVAQTKASIYTPFAACCKTLDL